MELCRCLLRSAYLQHCPLEGILPTSPQILRAPNSTFGLLFVTEACPIALVIDGDASVVGIIRVECGKARSRFGMIRTTASTFPILGASTNGDFAPGNPF